MSGPVAGVEPSAVALKPRRSRWVEGAKASAARIVGTLEPGCSLAICTAGQFGLTELLEAVLRQTGPADVAGIVWSCHDDDARVLGALRREGLIRSLTLVFDRSFPTRQPQRMPALREALGAENLYASNVHAKVVLVSAGTFRLVLDGSMNMNINLRLEHANIRDDADLYEHWRGIVRHITEHSAPGLVVDGTQFHEAFRTAPREPGGAVAVPHIGAGSQDHGAFLAEVCG